MLKSSPRIGVSLALWGKGGAAKTTTALSLAGLATAEGLRSIVRDADPQRSASAWHACSCNPKFAVHSVEVAEVAALLPRAKANYDVVIIDNPPSGYGGSIAIARGADTSLVIARPFQFDITLALEWISFPQRADVTPLVALTAAPPTRLDADAGTVRIARRRLGQAGAQVWRYQISHRLAHPELVARGMTITDLPATALARSEYERLWSAISTRMKKVAHIG
ncbi:ParA family protein [Devosia limi]|uniref:CobQ/CobB/MinD/ParA nucleotide binding domain-containing protein n=1 Tax=Devosia limi DSM 17137 TaxID=1121477 RepID=A0A1M5AQ15_9HYPH|nr:ParA family protein [Devosia limi]SHF32348.1 CobQ/CobB/MinD/ParA nucleotide binding domain-containing protein [Devosia limi DSM 17137]